MNQIEIQQQIRKERIVDKAQVIAAAKRVRRSQCNRNIWLVGSGNPKTPTRFYCMTWNEELDASFVIARRSSSRLITFVGISTAARSQKEA
jgi:hypothetical protein